MARPDSLKDRHEDIMQPSKGRVDAAVPVDAKNAPQGTCKRQRPRFPQRLHASNIIVERKQKNALTHTTPAAFAGRRVSDALTDVIQVCVDGLVFAPVLEVKDTIFNVSDFINKRHIYSENRFWKGVQTALRWAGVGVIWAGMVAGPVVVYAALSHLTPLAPALMWLLTLLTLPGSALAGNVFTHSIVNIPLIIFGAALTAGTTRDSNTWFRLMEQFMKNQSGRDEKGVLRHILDHLSTSPEARSALSPVKSMMSGGSSDDSLIRKAAEFLGPKILGYKLTVEVLKSMGLVRVGNAFGNEIVDLARQALSDNGIELRMRFIDEDPKNPVCIEGIEHSDFESLVTSTAKDKYSYQHGHLMIILMHGKILEKAVRETAGQEQAVKYLVIAVLREFFLSKGMSEEAVDDAGLLWDAEEEKDGGRPLNDYIAVDGIAQTLASIKGYSLTMTNRKKPAPREEPWAVGYGLLELKDRQFADLAAWVGMNLRVFRELKPFDAHQRVRRGAADNEEQSFRALLARSRELLKIWDAAVVKPRVAASGDDADELDEEAKTVHQFANEVEVALFDAIRESESELTAHFRKAIEDRKEDDFIRAANLTNMDVWNALINVYEGNRTQLQNTYFMGDAHDEKREAAMAFLTLAHWLCRSEDLSADARVVDLLENIHIALKESLVRDKTSGELINFAEYLTGETANPETRRVYNEAVFPYGKRVKRQEARAAEQQDGVELKQTGKDYKPTGTDSLSTQDLPGSKTTSGENYLYVARAEDGTVRARYLIQLDLNTMTLYVPRSNWYVNNPLAMTTLLAYAVEVPRSPQPETLKDAVAALRRIEADLEQKYAEKFPGEALPRWVRLSDILANDPKLGTAPVVVVNKQDKTGHNKEEARERARQALQSGRFAVVPPKRVSKPLDQTDPMIIEGGRRYSDVLDLAADSADVALEQARTFGLKNIDLKKFRQGREIQEWARDLFDSVAESQEVAEIIYKTAQPYVQEQERLIEERSTREEGAQESADTIPTRVEVRKNPQVLMLELSNGGNHASGYLLGKRDPGNEAIVLFSIKLSPIFVEDGIEESVDKKLPRMIGLFKAGAMEAQKRGYRKAVMEYPWDVRLTHRDAKAEEESIAEPVAERLKHIVGSRANAWKIIERQGMTAAEAWISQAAPAAAAVQKRVGEASVAWTIVIENGPQGADAWVREADRKAGELEARVGGKENALQIVLMEGPEDAEEWVRRAAPDVADARAEKAEPLDRAWQTRITQDRHAADRRAREAANLEIIHKDLYDVFRTALEAEGFQVEKAEGHDLPGTRARLVITFDADDVPAV